MLETNTFLYNQVHFISDFANLKFILIPSIVIPALFLLVRNYKYESLLLVTSILSFPLAQVLKALFKSPRPSLDNLTYYFSFDLYGFPSGHTIFYTVFWGFIFYLSFKLKKIDKVIRHASRWLAAYFIILIGASRMLLEVHYLKDIIGGYIIGAILLLTFIIIDKRLTLVKKPAKK
jgi:membrane-associated phospholipid phosphatase